MRAHPHYNPFNVREPSERPDWREIFVDNRPLDLEIGFSTGHWLLQYAKTFPERDIVGLEIRSKFIEYARRKIAAENLPNAYVLQANANTALKELFAPQSLSRAVIMFPDPWYKPRHLKRRVVTPGFLTGLAECLRPGAEVHIATDRQGLAEDMLADLMSAPEYRNKYADYAPQNFPGIVTDIERYNIERGKRIYRLVFVRQ